MPQCSNYLRNIINGNDNTTSFGDDGLTRKSPIPEQERVATSPQIGGMAPPTPRDSSGVARTSSKPCYPHTGSGGLNLVFEQIVRAMRIKATSNILYITVDNTPLLSKPSVCCPWVVAVVGVV